MPSTKEIRGRIKSVKNTRQITKAMELVAASKMKKAQQNASSGQAYAALLAEVLANVSGRIDGIEHSFFEEREVKTRGILVVSTDRGLCGALNSNLFREIVKIKTAAKYVTIGRKAVQFVSRNKLDLLAEFSVSDEVPYLQVKQIVEYMIEKYEAGEIDTIEILYPRFVNTLVQEASFGKLLPISNLDDMINGLRGKDAEPYQESLDDRMLKFEPDPEAILSSLLPLFVNREAHQALLNARASEHSARMVAMKSAKDNATTLLDGLTLQYNKARQAAITQEILEIAAATASNG
ncbi:ATP synthase F1 subunit gamma [Pelagicoccus sp. SDUM812002]|uniref:ATP synthase F1 subunit gamma n=1 Tax=Pelagicoccus sp. SDUM812002 TaxID=3041266 RepID=UPI00280E5591|nr:ATP synthase F1 subunit gamma [Pelagicoccus sp. SDUM812002]MDQ8184711.1 ATP synthase F1 subunit gamma [Pelagicoccus sp. SDUM812002]